MWWASSEVRSANRGHCGNVVGCTPVGTAGVVTGRVPAFDVTIANQSRKRRSQSLHVTSTLRLPCLTVASLAMPRSLRSERVRCRKTLVIAIHLCPAPLAVSSHQIRPADVDHDSL